MTERLSINIMEELNEDNWESRVSQMITKEQYLKILECLGRLTTSHTPVREPILEPSYDHPFYSLQTKLFDTSDYRRKRF